MKQKKPRIKFEEEKIDFKRFNLNFGI